MLKNNQVGTLRFLPQKNDNNPTTTITTTITATTEKFAYIVLLYRSFAKVYGNN